ncbi:MAG: hypothetical protein H7Z74_09515 [Anaerolineae bacterium]|nr:hypothetical protein [Gemmatimonadaceae bacterium]
MILPTIRQTFLVAATFGAALEAGSCRDAASKLGPGPTEARANAVQLFSALEARFGPLEFDSALSAARLKIARSALVPSRIFRDSSIWTSDSGRARVLDITGVPLPGGSYRLAIDGNSPPFNPPATYHRRLELRDIGRGVYEWRARDELAVGPIRGSDLGAAITAIFMALEGGGGTLRTEQREILARTSAALGRLYTLDTLAATPNPDGATEVFVVATMHPRRLATVLPHYAKYLNKYVSPLTYSLSLLDADEQRWGEATLRDRRFTFRFRVAGGNLAPMSAPPRRIPATLRVRMSLTAKALIFRVGFRDLLGDVTLQRDSNRSGFTATFRREPDWILPLLTERMLRAPLRRPFMDNGAELTFAISDSAGAATLATRAYRLSVQESSILRFLGKLGSSAISDFRAGAEREADQFTGEMWEAMGADVRDMIRDPD